ncbi:hypothetical protein FACS1894180_1560 [Bacteroidia bacterium]|nr:hypothetical protein FACS1894180_1560 [Bacteroidia bacterium]
MQKKIILELAVCLLALQAAAYFLFSVIYANAAFPLAFLAVPLFFMADGAVLAVFAKRHETQPPTPANLLAVKMLKFIGGMFVFVVLLYFYRQFGLFFSASFFAMYLFYLLYETFVLVRIGKKS